MKKLILTAAACLFVSSLLIGQTNLLNPSGEIVSQMTMGGSGMALLAYGLNEVYSWCKIGFEVDLDGINL